MPDSPAPKSRSPSRERDRGARRGRARSRERNGSRNGRAKSHSAGDAKEGGATERQVRDDGTVSIPVSDQDIAFVLGTAGKTKRKIARVTGATLNIDEKNLVIEIKGTEQEKTRAEEFVKLVMSQRGGSVYLDFDRNREDLTLLQVPKEAVGYVTGRKGNVLRSIEEEWGTMMFFVKEKETDDAEAAADVVNISKKRVKKEEGEGEKDVDMLVDNITGKHANKARAITGSSDFETLAIFGSLRGRMGSCLKVMSAMEFKLPGHVLEKESGELILDIEIFRDDYKENFGVETFPLLGQDFSYALGHGGSTRKKIAKASGAVLEYISQVAFMAGTKEDRQRAKDYLNWLIMQRKGSVKVETEGREDCEYVEMKQEYVGFVTGAKGASLRSIELRTDTFCFSEGDRNDRTKDTGRILVFSHSKENRRRAKEMIESKVKEKGRMDQGGGGGGSGGGGGGGGGGARDRDRRGGGRDRDDHRRGDDRRYGRDRDNRDNRNRDRDRWYGDRDRRGGGRGDRDRDRDRDRGRSRGGGRPSASRRRSRSPPRRRDRSPRRDSGRR